jgi:hypothetical protein
LSEKTNFEVTLLRAVEAGKSRSIDQVIRQISGLVPSVTKKKSKPPLASPVKPAETPVETKDHVSAENLSRSVYDTPSSPKNDGVSPAQVESSSQPIETQKSLAKPNGSEKVEPKEEIATIVEESIFEEPVAKRRIQDQKLIDQRTEALPDGVRHVLKNKFRADFVSIEKIDQDLLI